MASVGSVWARDVVGNRASQANQQQTWAGSITDVPGIKAGHYTDSRRPTGCTALLFEGRATAGVDYDRSEERRVGKEWRSRWPPHAKKEEIDERVTNENENE